MFSRTRCSYTIVTILQKEFQMIGSLSGSMGPRRQKLRLVPERRGGWSISGDECSAGNHECPRIDTSLSGHGPRGDSGQSQESCEP